MNGRGRSAHICRRRPARPGQRTYSAGQILDFQTLVRILQHWRWLILGAVVLGLVAAIIVTLLTTPIYRAWVTLEANPPTVAISDRTIARARHRRSTIPRTSSPPRSACCRAGASPSGPRRSSTSPIIPTSSPPDADASKRLKIAAGKVQGGLKVIAARRGQADQVQLRFEHRRSSPRWSPTASPTASSIRRFSADTKPRPTPAISSSGRSPRPAATSSARSARWSPMRRPQGIINTGSGEDGKPSDGDANSLQGESLVTLNKALADATARRVAAEGAYRQALATGPTTRSDDEHASRCASSSRRCRRNISRSARS